VHFFLCHGSYLCFLHFATLARRFQQWAFGDGGMREIWSNLPAQGQCLYPLLRSTSDLLMMPKDLLLEEGIRADMCSSVGGKGGMQ
jgi:hypothetical protein